MFWIFFAAVLIGLCYYVDHLPEEERYELDLIIISIRSRLGPVAVMIQRATLTTGNITVRVTRRTETETWVIKTSSPQRFLHKAELALKDINLNVDSGSHGVSATTRGLIHEFPIHCFI